MSLYPRKTLINAVTAKELSDDFVEAQAWLLDRIARDVKSGDIAPPTEVRFEVYMHRADGTVRAVLDSDFIFEAAS